jgi:hypothetical protein
LPDNHIRLHWELNKRRVFAMVVQSNAANPDDISESCIRCGGQQVCFFAENEELSLETSFGLIGKRNSAHGLLD